MHTPALKIAALIIAFIVSATAMAQKTDKVYLKDGDSFTGEIYYLKYAQLNFNMTSTGTVNIKWVEVVKLSSDKTFQVTLQHGQIFIAKLDSVFFEKNNLLLDEIAEIVQIKDNFFRNLVGSVGLGFNYTKSNNILQLNFNSSTTYIKPKAEISLVLNSIISNYSGDSLISKNQDATISVLRHLSHNYNLFSSLGWQQNTQLGLANRFIIAAGGGKTFLSDNEQRLLTGTGLSYNIEESGQSNEYTSNLEAVAGIKYKRFRYLTPKISIDASYNIYAGLTDWGRIRMNFNLDTKYEVFKDFNIGLTFYDNYDNRPPAGAASQNDFGINFTLGYSFGR